MQQAKFSLTAEQLQFLQQYRVYGFRDRSEVVRTALERLRQDLARQELEESARLYAQVYQEDLESKTWVQDSLLAWPDA